MTGPQAWLPTMALFDGALTQVVGASLGNWRQKWFARPGRLSVRLQAGSRKQQGRMEGWRSTCGSLSTCADRERMHRLGAALLGFSRTPRTIGPADAKLLQKLSEDASRDLLVMLATRFAASSSIEQLPLARPSRDVSPPLCFAVIGTYGRLFDLVISAASAASARKSLATPRRERAPLTSRKALCDTLRVNVSGRVGTSQISAADLQSLAVNDVLILDSRLTETPLLAINGRVQNDGRLSLARSGASLVIRSNEDRAT